MVFINCMVLKNLSLYCLLVHFTSNNNWEEIKKKKKEYIQLSSFFLQKCPNCSYIHFITYILFLTRKDAIITVQ